jgi:hypothetical protein
MIGRIIDIGSITCGMSLTGRLIFIRDRRSFIRNRRDLDAMIARRRSIPMTADRRRDKIKATKLKLHKAREVFMNNSGIALAIVIACLTLPWPLAFTIALARLR